MLRKFYTTLLFALAACVLNAATLDQNSFVRSIQLKLPEGKDFFKAYDLIRGDEGLPIDRLLVDRHVNALGDLGWVSAVDVDIQPTPDSRHFDLIYHLLPRATIQEIRFEGNEVVESELLYDAMLSRPGKSFDLKIALTDAHQINLMYQDAGYAFSGVLDSDNIEFEHGILTFKVRESRLSEKDRLHLEDRLQTELSGPLHKDRLADVLAHGDLTEALDLDQLKLKFNRRSGQINLGQAEAPKEKWIIPPRKVRRFQRK